MNCCAIESSIKQSSSIVNDSVREDVSEPLMQDCTNCGGHSRPLSRKTMLLMLKPELLEHAMTGAYSFCSAMDCAVVYFEERGSHQFTVDDLRVRVGLKAKRDPIPLCY